jgi:magnesium-transporting ATPase (P-type)
LISANIRVWVLTGDKKVFQKLNKETALEIGKACKLVQEDMYIVDLTMGYYHEQEIKKFICILEESLSISLFVRNY